MSIKRFIWPKNSPIRIKFEKDPNANLILKKIRTRINHPYRYLVNIILTFWNFGIVASQFDRLEPKNAFVFEPNTTIYWNNNDNFLFPFSVWVFVSVFVCVGKSWIHFIIFIHLIAHCECVFFGCFAARFSK